QAWKGPYNLHEAHGPELDACEEDWAKRTAQVATAAAAELSKKDPAQATTHLRKAADVLATVGKFPAANATLLDGRRRAGVARLEAVRRQAKALVAKDRFIEASELAERFEADVREEAALVGEARTVTAFRDLYAALAEVDRRLVRGLEARLLALGCWS